MIKKYDKIMIKHGRPLSTYVRNNESVPLI